MKKILTIISILGVINSQCLGDLNQDDGINILDVILIVNIILESTPLNEIADLNSDQIINVLDIISIINIIINDGLPCQVTWGEETTALPDYYFTTDIGIEQVERVSSYYNIAKSAWGNFGPLEFWIIGLDSYEAELLDQYYCELRIEKDSCLDNSYLQWCLNREYSFTDYAENGGAGLSLNREQYFNCDSYSNMEITLSSQYPFPNESDYDVVTMHEYFHAYQQSHIYTYDYNQRAELMVINPWWSEGGAEYMAQLLYSQQPEVSNNYLATRMGWKMQSKNALSENELISNIPYGERAFIAYDLGAWAIAYLISIVGLDAYRVNFYNDLNEYGWEESFVMNFNMTSDNFMIDFHNFIDLEIEEQLNILP